MWATTQLLPPACCCCCPRGGTPLAPALRSHAASWDHRLSLHVPHPPASPPCPPVSTSHPPPGQLRGDRQGRHRAAHAGGAAARHAAPPHEPAVAHRLGCGAGPVRCRGGGGAARRAHARQACCACTGQPALAAHSLSPDHWVSILDRPAAPTTYSLGPPLLPPQRMLQPRCPSLRCRASPSTSRCMEAT